MSEHKFTNALADETSPYLLQHAHNPVNWYPWTEEALRRAREEDKPILLSIGYSACHWCHVMECESFENEQIAQIMNRHFINIKVDREERPDLDSIYMTAVQIMTGSGGWPMTVFLTPEGVPFYAGTYFPPEDRHGMPAFPRVLLSVAGAYRDKKDLIRNDAARIIEGLRKSDSFGNSKGNLDVQVLDTAASNLLAGYEPRHGGFGHAPKFPPSMALTFLLRSAVRTGKTPPLEAVERTLQKMAQGGIYDQLGGGFHRYSVDDHWLVPHFEKMLYDNALLSRVYLDAFLLTGNRLYRRVAEETLDYVLREMTSPEGGFYSSQDADSEGHEGKFFTWKHDEVMEILGRVEGEVFCRFYGITPQGNFEGENILNIPEGGGAETRPGSLSEEQFQGIIEKCRDRLLETRERRVRPGRDEKVLTAWNGLMLRSFAEAACALEREDYREIATRNAEFLVSNLQRDGRLLRSWKDGQARLNGYLEDYAFLIDGLLSVYEATFDPGWIREAERMAAFLVGNFWDADSGSFYLTAGDHETLIHRPKDLYDNAMPSGNSGAAHALLRLAEFTGNSGWADFSRSVLAGMADVQANHPSAFSNYLCALDFLLSSPKQIAIQGNPAAPETRNLLRQVFGRYMPNKVVACGEEGGIHLLKNRTQKKGRPTVYVCRGSVCQAPVTTVEELRAVLNAR